MQDVSTLMALIILLLSFASTYVFQAGLIFTLIRRFAATIVIALLYLIASVVYHATSLVDILKIISNKKTSFCSQHNGTKRTITIGRLHSSSVLLFIAFVSFSDNTLFQYGVLFSGGDLLLFLQAVGDDALRSALLPGFSMVAATTCQAAAIKSDFKRPYFTFESVAVALRIAKKTLAKMLISEPQEQSRHSSPTTELISRGRRSRRSLPCYATRCTPIHQSVTG